MQRECWWKNQPVGQLLSVQAIAQALKLACAASAVPFCLVTSAPAQGQPPNVVPVGSVRGVVTNPEGEPVAFVAVAATVGSRAAYTDSSGEFFIRGLRPGRDSFIVRKLGYTPLSFSLVVPPDSVLSLAVRLTPTMARLPDVITTAEISPRLRSVGFAERESRFKGLFITTSDIEARASTRTTDFLQGAPRIAFRSFGARGKIPYGGSGCVMQVVVDGFPVQLDPRPILLLTLDDVINPSMIEGMEVYSGATDTPLQFQAITRACGTIVIWTRK